MKSNWIRKPAAEPMTVQEIGDVSILTFPALTQSGLVTHACSTRFGGVSQPPFDTMNFTIARGDNPDHVMENYRRMADALGVDVNRMVLSWQTHTTNVRTVTAADAGKGICKDREYRDVDGLITNVPGLTLVTFYADCVPLYLVDPVHKAIGLSHSGWRGTVGRMGRVTLEAMNREYGTCPEDVIAAIGPSICQSCFEVGPEVIEAFQKQFDQQYWKELYYSKPNGKYQLDLWAANRIIFQEAGVPEQQIHITDICTHCNPGSLFSHRAMGEKRGNLAAFMTLHSDN